MSATIPPSSRSREDEVLNSSARVRQRRNRIVGWVFDGWVEALGFVAGGDAPACQAFPPQNVSDFMQKAGWRGPFAKNLYAATAAILGILLWGSALLDWAGYTRFVLSLRWF